MNEEIKKLQAIIPKLEERIAKLEQAAKFQETNKEATAVDKAMAASEASIRKLEED